MSVLPDKFRTPLEQLHAMCGVYLANIVKDVYIPWGTYSTNQLISIFLMDVMATTGSCTILHHLSPAEQKRRLEDDLTLYFEMALDSNEGLRTFYYEKIANHTKEGPDGNRYYIGQYRAPLDDPWELVATTDNAYPKEIPPEYHTLQLLPEDEGVAEDAQKDLTLGIASLITKEFPKQADMLGGQDAVLSAVSNVAAGMRNG